MPIENQIDLVNNNILTLIHFDVCFALKNLEKQVKDKQRRTLLIRSNRELFDVGEFTKYLSEVAINNTYVLKDILKKSYEIIDLNNNDFIELERLEEEYSGDLNFSTPDGEGGFFKISVPFECITIENKKMFKASNHETGYKHFFEQGHFDLFTSQDFAHKCARLINLITAAYPDLKIETKENVA